jgi:hypothetical protein
MKIYYRCVRNIRQLHSRSVRYQIRIIEFALLTGLIRLVFQFPVLIPPRAVVSYHIQLAFQPPSDFVIVYRRAVVADHCIMNICAPVDSDVQISHHSYVGT